MRKILLAVITAAAAGVMITGSVALASAQASPPSHAASTHSVTTAGRHCNTLISGAPNGSHSRFHVSPITNTCNDTYRALDLCMGRTGSGTREYGPWESGYSESNTSSCPSGTQVVEGATQYPRHGSHTYCLWGCSNSLLSYQAPAVPSHVLCTEVSAGQVNQSAGNAAVWWRQNTTDCGFYIRVRIQCASRFNGDKLVYGGFVEGLFPVESGAQCPPDHSQLQIVWQQVKFTKNGPLSTCQRFPSDQCPVPVAALKR